jgi:hypothetical protein
VAALKGKITRYVRMVKEALSNSVISTKIVKKFSASPQITHDLELD